MITTFELACKKLFQRLEARFDRFVLPGLHLDDPLRAGHGILYLSNLGAGNCSRPGSSIRGASTGTAAGLGFHRLHSPAPCRDESEFSAPFQTLLGAFSSPIFGVAVSGLRSVVVV